MTKKIADLVSVLGGYGVKFWLEGDELRFRGPDDAVNLPEFAEIRERKSELIGFLKALERNSIPPVSASSRTGDSPLTHAQAYWWWLDEEMGCVRHHLTFGGQLLGPLDKDKLEQALNTVVDRHPILRSAYHRSGQKVVQHTNKGWDEGITHTNLEDLSREDALAECTAIMERDIAEPFDLANGPVFRARIITIAPNHHGIVLAAHQIVLDFMGWHQIFGELFLTYGALVAGSLSPLPQPVLDYRDFAFWEEQYVTGPNMANNNTQWRERLDVTGRYRLPYSDKARNELADPAIASFRQIRTTFKLPVEAHRRLRDLANRYGNPVPATIAAAFFAFLARWTCEKDLVASHFIAGRPPGLEAVIGPYLTPRPISVSISGDLSFLNFSAQIRQTLAAAYSVTHVLDAATQMHAALRQVVFSVVQGAMPKSGGHPIGEGLMFEAFAMPADQYRETTHEIGFYFTETPVGLELMMAYAEELFTAEEIEQAVELFTETLMLASADANASMAAILQLAD